MSIDILAAWQGETAVLGTKHHKEAVIAPLIKRELGITVTVPADFDTDQFGTFTRDISRVGTPYEVAKRKALAAATASGHTLALASEGSFGTHPILPLLPYHAELVTLIDIKRHITVTGYHEDTNLKAEGQTVRHAAEAVAIATTWGFPHQGVIIRRSETSKRDIYKDIRTLEELEATVAKLLKGWFQSTVYLETDMRAHSCPRRMVTIEKATENLIARCRQLCPHCGTPGFVTTKTTHGLPCGHCGSPTELPTAFIAVCQRCHYELAQPAATGMADPSACSYCNP